MTLIFTYALSRGSFYVKLICFCPLSECLLSCILPNDLEKLQGFKRFKCQNSFFCHLQVIIPPFHWTAFPPRSWRSRSFSKIIPNRSRSVESHTIWGLHASSTLPLRFYYASVTLLPRCSRFGCVVIALLLRSRYGNEDPATLSLR